MVEPSTRLIAFRWKEGSAASSDVSEGATRGTTTFVVRDGIAHTIFEHEATGARLDYVSNSGICETTPGVAQHSGYLNVGGKENLFFWFFEARHNATAAPLAAWFNGGPGCSSMVGLFQENGPCNFANNNATVPTLNPYSFNEYANMLYIDQPIATGFSYGDDNVNSTLSSAPYIWRLLQAFYSQFPQYKNRDFGIFTESYGGHYGPQFASYFEQQNTAIAAGKLKGLNIPLVALGINNGWYDAILQEKATVHFSYNNTYKPLITASQHTSFLKTYNDQCLPLLEQCNALEGNNTACANAQDICYNDIDFSVISVADFDAYDVRAPFNNPVPPKNYMAYLQQDDVVKKIGAQGMYQECNAGIYELFQETGDNSRSYLPTLSTVVQSGIQTLIWAGDADWICNWFGGLASAEALTYSGSTAFKKKAVSNYTVNGATGGTFKTEGNLSWLRVFGAGHEVPYYQPALALQAFKQTMQKKTISST
ncbi:alpha/beta-hydrolase [Hyaloscypha variabilis F]|uniref:Carboxypeptidase n=1 Tax=Hyaloscypha variabilis (strain UAMH 11265 / GT02V1 / F) TaxID=1149755 RepID=A0A2J6QVQ4_HYAVF|nr:alpha/beta-hydrolase [Hyaloscypha variabilis F]